MENPAGDGNNSIKGILVAAISSGLSSIVDTGGVLNFYESEECRPGFIQHIRIGIYRAKAGSLSSEDTSLIHELDQYINAFEVMLRRAQRNHSKKRLFKSLLEGLKELGLLGSNNAILSGTIQAIVHDVLHFPTS